MTRKSLLREFVTEQTPLLALVLALGFGAAELQHGFLPGGDVAFPLAGVKVPVWHLVWMGFWTGYTMAMVGEAAGIFALPYTMSIRKRLRKGCSGAPSSTAAGSARP